MKTHSICTMALLFSSVAFSQAAPQSNTKPADKQAAATAPVSTQTLSQRYGQPQAKSKDEFAAYQSVSATADLNAAMKGADDFAQKYPQSDLRYVLYAQILQKANAANQSELVMDAGHKVLAIEPTDVMSLVLVSNAISETTHDTDLDQDEKYAEAMKDAAAAVKNIDTGLVVPPQVPAEQAAAAKRQLLSMAQGTMGYIELNRKNYGISEKYLKDAIAANPDQPDSTNYLRLTVAQDKQEHYADALASVDKAMQFAQAENNTALLNIAKNEKDRLSKLASGSKKQ